MIQSLCALPLRAAPGGLFFSPLAGPEKARRARTCTVASRLPPCALLASVRGRASAASPLAPWLSFTMAWDSAGAFAAAVLQLLRASIVGAERRGDIRHGDGNLDCRVL